MYKRINLCFDMADPEQRAAYEALMLKGTKKTATVVAALFQAPDILETVGKIMRENNEEVLRELRNCCNAIIKRLGQSPEQNKPGVPKIEWTDAGNEASEDEAFDIMVSAFGP